MALKLGVLFLLIWGGLETVAKADWNPSMVKTAARWQAWLQSYVNEQGGVDYISAQGKGQKELASILESYDAFDISSLKDHQKTALLINMYNAGMIANIYKWAEQEKIDVKSQAFYEQRVNKISAPGGNIWNGKWTFGLGGEQLNLDNIEHDLIRGKASSGKLGQWKVKVLDPRIHAAVNCAAFSCPQLVQTAYTPQQLDAMLSNSMKLWLRDPEQFAKLSDSKMKANQIVQWYYEDFDQFGRQSFKKDGAGDYLASWVPKDRGDAAWLQAHFKKTFNGRSKLMLHITSDYSFHYDWRIADSRIKK